MAFSTQLLRHALRRLIRAPAFAITAALTLALGIGATTAVYTLVDAVLIRPLPYADPGRLVDLSHTLSVSGVMNVDQSDATYLYYRRASRAFVDIGAYRTIAASLGATTGGRGATADRPAHVAAAGVSASVFRVLRALPTRGRTFVPRDDDPGAPPVVMISERLWRATYGADPAIIGRRVQVDGVEHEIVGIMPDDFRFPAANTDVWLPIGIDPAHTKSAAFDYRAVGRLRDGVTLDAATADLQRLLPEVPEAFPGRLSAQAIAITKMRAVIRPLRAVVVGDVGRVLWIVLGAVAFVLLVACANVANLFLVRAEGRQQELAVRRALGAGRVAIAAELVSEGIVLAAGGGAVGLALATVGVQALRSLNAGVDLPRLAEVSVDGVTVAVALALTTLAVLFVSILPAMRWTAFPESRVLTESSRAMTPGRARHHARHALVVSQVALALMLLAGAGLMARSFARLRAVQPGFDASRTATFRLALPSAEYPASSDVTRFLVTALGEMAKAPGVQAVGVATKVPLDAIGRSDTALFVRDHPLSAGKIPNVHQAAFVSPDYFRALGIPLVDGRTFGAVDPADARRELIVSRALALRYWSDGKAVGKLVRMIPVGDWYTIVGVAGDVRGSGLDQPADETIYLPLVTDPLDDPAARWTPRDVAFVVRSAGSGSATLAAARAEHAVSALAPSLPVYASHDMSDLISRSEAATTVTLSLLGIASIAALVLGAVGIYGVVAYSVGLRTRELAVRIALGADPAGIRRMVSRQALGVASIGVVVGLAGAVGVTRVLATLLYGVSPTDVPTLGASAILLLGVAGAASWIPARRAAAVDPAAALRSD